LTEIRKAGVTPVVIGGDHSLLSKYKSLMNTTAGRVGVINIDSTWMYGIPITMRSRAALPSAD
jgi:hypothetical protein